MKITDLFETTAASIATVPMPLGTLRRPSIFGYSVPVNPPVKKSKKKKTKKRQK